MWRSKHLVGVLKDFAIPRLHVVGMLLEGRRGLFNLLLPLIQNCFQTYQSLDNIVYVKLKGVLLPFSEGKLIGVLEANDETALHGVKK